MAASRLRMLHLIAGVIILLLGAGLMTDHALAWICVVEQRGSAARFAARKFPSGKV
jgi:hypothetical protein